MIVRIADNRHQPGEIRVAEIGIGSGVSQALPPKISLLPDHTRSSTFALLSVTRGQPSKPDNILVGDLLVIS